MNAFHYGAPGFPTIVATQERHPLIAVANPALAYHAAASNPALALSMPHLNPPGGPNVVSPWVGEENRAGGPDHRYARTPVVRPH